VHILFVARSFPSPEHPARSPFIREQVRLLCECTQIDRITVLSPTTFVPKILRRARRVAAQVTLPERYEMVPERCEVLFPRYIKAPGDWLFRWTVFQWCRMVDQTVIRFANTCPVSLIHANAGSESSWAAICAAKKHRLPCVVTYQGTEVHVTLAQRRTGWQLCRDSFRLADLNISVSRSLERILRQHAQPSGRCEVLLRGVDQTRFFPPAQLTIDPKVLFVGRIEKAKGAFDLLSAWKEVLQVYPDAELIMVGPDRTGGNFLRHAQKCGIDKAITLTGSLSSPAVADLMRQCRIVCLPSHGEGTPNVVMEAMACGLPVVATLVGGIPDIVEDGKTGFLVGKGDTKSLAVALLLLLRDFDCCRRMGQAALLYARAHLDARKTVSRLVNLYGELITNSFLSESAAGRPLPG
jgi:glycosyltransferase involved in cell wall biosynthesis